MDGKKINGIDTSYDVKEIIAITRKKYRNSILLSVIFLGLLAISVTAAVLYSTIIPVFVVSVILACVSVFACIGQIKKIRLSDCNNSCGRVEYVMRECVPVRAIAGGVGLFRRRYDNYIKDTVRITVYIKEEDKVYAYQLNSVTEKHADYYESTDEALHIMGAPYPVSIEAEGESWLCPICGEFNPKGERRCSKCGVKVLK